jgi:hypothetical protein
LGVKIAHVTRTLGDATIKTCLIKFADLGRDDVIKEPIDWFVIVKHQEELNKDWQAEMKKRSSPSTNNSGRLNCPHLNDFHLK